MQTDGILIAARLVLGQFSRRQQRHGQIRHRSESRQRATSLRTGTRVIQRVQGETSTCLAMPSGSTRTSQLFQRWKRPR